MAVVDIKENVRLKLELDGGMVGDKQIVRSKTLSRIKADADNEHLHSMALNLAGLQKFPLLKVKKLEEIELKEE